MSKPAGRPRKPLPGGHAKRRPGPTEDARLKQVVREMGRVRKKTVAREPAGAEHREKKPTKDGRTIVVLKAGHHQGRPPGAKSVVPAGVRASVKAILEDVVSKRKKTVRRAIIDGIQSGPRHSDRFLRLAAEYVDGKPTDNVNLNARWNQDELSEAKDTLGKKLDGILAIILTREAEAKKK